MFGYKKIVTAFLAEYRRSNDLRERELTIKERARQDVDLHFFLNQQTAKSDNKVSKHDQIKKDVRKSLNARVRVSPASFVPDLHRAAKVITDPEDSQLLLEKVLEVKKREGTDPRALSEEHRTDSRVYPPHIPVPFPVIEPEPEG
jgi:hypothetical protein